VKLIKVLTVGVLFLFKTSSGQQIDTIPIYYIDRIDSLPDYYQRDREFGGFPLGGSMYCGPTAAANAILPLLRLYNCEKNSNGSITEKQQIYEIIKKLGSQSYINTGKSGSGPSQICNGLQKYFRDNGISNVEIRHFGWRDAGIVFQAGNAPPILDSARLSLFKNDAVIVNFGWYDYNTKKNTYTRTGGHWVTLAGYGFNGKSADSSCIIVHDPETPRSVNDYKKLKRIESGTLKGIVNGLPRDASGYYCYSLGFGRFGIIDGFITISVKDAQKKRSHDNVS
jgi:hypothetical protein